jgi:RNA polymerase sigma-70 factor, ECF subfamily
MVAGATWSQASATRTPATHPRRESEAVMPNVDVAYRLARWLVEDDRDADEIVLESVRIAVRRGGPLPGDAGRAWFLRIVREVCSNRSRFVRTGAVSGVSDAIGSDARTGSRSGAATRHSNEASALEEAIRTLPDHLREVLVLRELEGLPIEELADVLSVPAATVASRLSRARLALAGVLFAEPVAV